MMQIIFLSLFFLFLPVFFTPQVFAFSGSGSGSSGDPYQITTCSQLHEIANNLSADYLLMNDVNCNGFSFTPIGDTTSNFFVGRLDGGGHKITNLNINADTNGVGIFQEIGSGGVITNIGYDSGSVTAGSSVQFAGSFAGRSSGASITKSYSKVNVDGSAASGFSAETGGFVSFASLTTISDSYYSGTVTNSSSSPYYSGGFVSYLDGGSITNSYTSGSMVNGHQVGGIAGNLGSNATISNSFSTITFTNTSNVGALVGNIYSGTITNSYWNDTSGGGMTCYFGGNTGCTRITSNLAYFYAVSNAPMSSWDFINTWSTINNGTNYPLLYWQSPNPTPTSTPVPTSTVSSNTPSSIAASTTQTPVCGNAAPTTPPDLFQLRSNGNSVTLYFAPDSGQNSGYYVSYGLGNNAEGFGAQFEYSNSGGAVAYTVNDLFPGTWYFKVRGQNGCMPGNWSGVLSLKVNGLGSSSTEAGTTNVLGATSVNLGNCTNYTVQSGDSLWQIANLQLGQGTLYQTIMQKNHLSSSLIRTGQTLKVGCE